MYPVGDRISVVAGLIVAGNTTVSTEVGAVIEGAPVGLIMAIGTTWRSIVIAKGAGNPELIISGSDLEGGQRPTVYTNTTTVYARAIG